MFKRFFVLLVIGTQFLFAVAPAARPKASSLQNEWKRIKNELRGRVSERIAANKILANNGWVPIPKKGHIVMMRELGRLVDLPENEYLTVDKTQIPAHRRVTTPGFANYIRRISLIVRVPL